MIKKLKFIDEIDNLIVLYKQILMMNKGDEVIIKKLKEYDTIKELYLTFKHNQLGAKIDDMMSFNQK